MADAAAPEPRAGRLQIGAVVAALRDEFPDVSVSKIRFLEGEGLVRPSRSASGYRYFSPQDVDRIRFILRAQRDRFWPLKVIAEALDAMDRGLVPDAAPARPRAPRLADAQDAPPASALVPSTEALRLRPAELADAAGLPAEYVSALMSFGLLLPDADGYLGPDDVLVAQAASRLAQRGLEARHLRPFRLAADREVALVEQTSGSARAGAARERAAEEILHECLALHAALVRAGLGRTRR